jgi:hypothetical protein
MRAFPVAETAFRVAEIVVAGIVAAACLPASLSAQTPAAQAPASGAARTSPNGSVPRTSEGKPSLTGVWQGGNNRRGTWEQANSGLGVGGTGRDLAAPANLGSQQVVSEPAPYQPWAARKVLESFNRRGIDDPAALCLPPGLPRLAITGLFPQQIIQTPQQIVILYEYMNVFRVIPLDAKHHDDLVPTYLGDSVGHWEGDQGCPVIASANTCN